MPLDAFTPVGVTVTAGEWNQVIDQLAAGPYRTVAPLIQKIVEQVQRAEAGHVEQTQDQSAQNFSRLQPVS